MDDATFMKRYIRLCEQERRWYGTTAVTVREYAYRFLRDPTRGPPLRFKPCSKSHGVPMSERYRHWNKNDKARYSHAASQSAIAAHQLE